MAFLQHRHDAAHVLDAPRAGFGDDRVDRGRDLGVVHLGGEEAFDHRDLGALRGGELGAAAFLVKLDRFAPLLHHLLEHLGDEHVVLRRVCAAAKLDVAILERGLDQPDRVAPRRVAGLHRIDQGLLDVVANHGSQLPFRETDHVTGQAGL